MSVFLLALIFCSCGVFLLSILTMFLLLPPNQAPGINYNLCRDDRQATEVFINNMVDTKIRETAIDCGVEVERRRNSGRADQVLKAIGKGKGEYED